MENNIEKENTQTNKIDINNLPANKTGKEIKQQQEENRNKYQSEFNIYHDKNKMNKDSNIVLLIIGIVILIILIIILLSNM